MSVPSLDILIGASWKVDARCLARLYAFNSDDDRFDYSPILDIIDIVIDGANITSRLPEESIFCVMQELVTGLHMMAEGRVDKHIVVFPEANWELAVQRAGADFELSFYGTQRPRRVTIHNLRVPQGRLMESVCFATERLLDDLVELNDAFAGERTVRGLERQLQRLRSRRKAWREDPVAPVVVPSAPERVDLSSGDQRLGLTLEFNATHADFWRYQGALVSDLHSLLFRGGLYLTYWGKQRVLGSATYLFPLVEGLVAGAERLLQRLEKHAGGCVLLDGQDGSESLWTAEVLGADTVLLRVTEPKGAVGQTRAPADALFGVILDAAQRLVTKITDLNPHQALNHRVLDLRAAVERLRGRFCDIRQGDVYYDAAHGDLLGAPAAEAVDGGGTPRRRMAVPITHLRHVFLRSAWYLARKQIEFRGVTAAASSLLVPSRGKLDCIARSDGRVAWTADGERLLLARAETCLTGRDGTVQCRDVASGRVRWQVSLASSPSATLPFRLGGKWSTCLMPSEHEMVTVSLETGRTLWSMRLDHGEIAGATVAGPVLALVADDGFAYGLKADSGRILWKVRVPGTCVLPPTHHAGRLYVCADADVGLEGVLYCIDPLSGRRLYERRAAASFARPPLFVGNLAVLTLETPAHANLVGIDVAEGRAAWSLTLESAQVDTPVMAWMRRRRRGTLVVKSDTGECLGLRLPSGAVRWRAPLLEAGDILLANLEPVALDDHLVIAERFVSVLDPATGERVHRFTDLPEHPTYLHVDDNLRLILGEGDDHLECFDLRGFLAVVG